MAEIPKDPELATKDKYPLADQNVSGWRVHSPVYIWLPAAAALIWVALFSYRKMTGRDPIDDVPFGALWNIMGMVVACIFTNNAKKRLFSDLDTRDKTLPWWRIVIDSCETAFLLILFCWFVFR